MTEIVNSRIGALVVLLFGPGDRPEQTDAGRYKWSLRHSKPYAIATWRHADNWNRAVSIYPVGPTQVEIEFPSGETSKAFDDEQKAIDAAIQFMETSSGGGGPGER